MSPSSRRGKRGRGAAELRAEGLEAAPAARPAAVGEELAGLAGESDGPPHGLDEPLGGAQVVLVGLVADHLPVAEVDQLQQRGHHATGAPQDQGVEAHLEQRLALEADPGRAAGLVVHHPDRTVGGHVDAVDEAAQQQPRVEQRLDVELALGGLEPARVLQGEVGAHALAAGGQPLDDALALAGEELGRLRLGVEHELPGGLHHRLGAARASARGQAGRRGPPAPCARPCRAAPAGTAPPGAGRSCAAGRAADRCGSRRPGSARSSRSPRHRRPGCRSGHAARCSASAHGATLGRGADNACLALAWWP